MSSQKKKKGGKSAKKKDHETILENKTGRGNKGEKENIVKVKKAKEIDNQPEHSKFIDDIIHRSKNTSNPTNFSHSMSSFGKPIVEYSPEKKGIILEGDSAYKHKSHWAKPITEPKRQIPNNVSLGACYIGVNEPPKSPYKTK